MVRLYHIALVMGGLGLLAWLGKRYPDTLGRFTHKSFGPRPHHGQSASQYYLRWAGASFAAFFSIILVGSLVGAVAHWFGWMDNAYFLGPFVFTMFLLPIVALVRTVENLVKALRHRSQVLIFDQEATGSSQQHAGQVSSEAAPSASPDEPSA